MWKIIHRILHPNPKPLRIDPDEFHTHFASTTERVTGAIPEPTQNLWSFINTLPDVSTNAFHLREVSYQKVLNEIKNLCSDCSCGPDGIPVKYIEAAIPLTLEDRSYLRHSKSSDYIIEYRSPSYFHSAKPIQNL